MAAIDKNRNDKKGMRSPEAVEAFFKQAENMTVVQRISLYRGLLSSTLMMLDEDRSKEAKRFKYDFDKHLILIKFMQCVVANEVVEASFLASYDFKKGLIPLLKVHGAQLKDIAITQLLTLLEGVVQGVELPARENLLLNGVAVHAAILHELFALPVKDVVSFNEIAKKVRDCSAERLCLACETIEKEVASSSVGKIRCLWLLEVLMQNVHSINYAWGEWRLTKMVERISQDHLEHAQQKEELTEQEHAMAYDLLVASGRINPAEFGKHAEDCGCGHEHEEQSCSDI